MRRGITGIVRPAGTAAITAARKTTGIRAALRVIPGISRQKEPGLKPRARAGLAKRTARRAGTAAVSRSEGGPGRGYYLNGVFYPYTDDEKDQ